MKEGEWREGEIGREREREKPLKILLTLFVKPPHLNFYLTCLNMAAVELQYLKSEGIHSGVVKENLMKNVELYVVICFERRIKST